MNKIAWLASYPKSGNTMIRAFLSVYITGMMLDLNNINGSMGDTDGFYFESLLGKPVKDVTVEDRLLVRPAALYAMSQTLPFDPVIVKTHWLRGVVCGMPTIPEPITKSAIYIVRDPRAVAPSYAKHMGLSLDDAIKSMTDKENALMQEDGQLRTVLSSWNDHVLSWSQGEAPYPTSVIRYEDIIDNREWAHKNIIKAFGLPFREKPFEISLQQSSLDHMRALERKTGFKEQSGKEAQFDGNQTFFTHGNNEGWRSKLTAAHVKKIESNSKEAMDLLGYDRDS